ncbi:MAG: hypothetical protein Q4B59_03670 [Lachnospiraceae bacterium]|nr:hypothetical protein [Lachnospiraceae bacterium]
MKKDRMTKEQFREMNLKAKLQWLLQYYGLTTLVVIIALLVIFNLVKTVLFPAPEPDGHMVLLTDEFVQENALAWQKELEQQTGKDILIEVFNVSDLYGQASFSAKMGVDQIDLVVVPENEKDMLLEAEAIEKATKLELTDLYMAVTTTAREGETLEAMIAYFEKTFDVTLER